MFNVGSESQPIAGSIPVNRVRRWLNTTPTLTVRMILVHQRLQQPYIGYFAAIVIGMTILPPPLPERSLPRYIGPIVK